MLIPIREIADDYWAALFRRRWIIVFMTVLAGIFTGYFSSQVTPLYESKAQFYVPQDVVLTQGGPEAGGMRVPGLKDQARAYLALLETPDAYRAVSSQVPERSYDDIWKGVDFDVTPAASLTIYARDKDAALSARIAQLFIEHFQSFHSNVMRQDLSVAISRVDERLETILANKRNTEQARWEYLREHRLGAPTAALAALEAQRAAFDERIGTISVDLQGAEQRIASLSEKLASEESAFRAGKVAAGVSDGLYASLRRDLTNAHVDKDTIEARERALVNRKQDAEQQIINLTKILERLEEFAVSIARDSEFIASLQMTRVSMSNELLRLKDTIVVIEAPFVPNAPIFPIVWLNVLVGMLGGLLTGIIYCLFLDHLSRRDFKRRLAHLDDEEWFEDLLSEFTAAKPEHT